MSENLPALTGSEALVPPTNISAEWSVLGHMLYTPDLIGEVVGVPLETMDFSQPDTRAIYHATVTRYYSGQPVDVLIVGEMARDELASYWGSDPSNVSNVLRRRTADARISGSVLEHAAIVKRLSTSRKVLDVCIHALADINAGERTPEEISDSVSTDLLQISSGSVRRTEMRDWMTMGTDYLMELNKLIRAKREGVEIGVYTGLDFIDDWTTGIGPGEVCVLAGDPGAGKALALDTPIATRGGWTTMGQIAAGETVFDGDGKPCRVRATSAVQFDRRCYRVVFDDGQAIVADAEHLWVTSTRNQRHNQGGAQTVKTTEEIAATIRRSDAGFNHRIANAGALELDERPLAAHPWMLGFWLGDGNNNAAIITVGASDLQAVRKLALDVGYETTVKETGITKAAQLYVGSGLGGALSALGVFQAKHIPVEYQRASTPQRWSLLAGLVDSDGYVGDDGGTEICTINERLGDDICELVASLGMKYRCVRSRATIDGRFAGWRHRITFTPNAPVALLTRKRKGGPVRDLCSGRFIKSVTPVPSVPVRCIAVESPTLTYLAGRAMIPTHNTAIGWNAALGFAARQLRYPKPVSTLVLSMEMNDYSSTARLVSNITGIHGTTLREGALTPEAYQLIVTEWKNREKLPIFFNFSSNFRLSQMRALIAEGIRRANVGFVVIDHFRMIDTDRKFQNPNQEDENKIRFIKEQIARELNVAVLLLAHTIKVGRGQGGENPRPRLSDLRGSGQIAAFADFVAMAWNPNAYMSDDAPELMGAPNDEGDRELLWVKNRFGTPSSAPYMFDAKVMRVGPRPSR